ncbi:hypothetical protein Tco_0785758 [Tanacetum coccineum]
MVEEEPVKKMSKKEILKLDKKLAFKLQDEEDEEERLTREKAQKVKEANIAWDDIQAKVKADYQLSQRLQAQQKEELSDAEKATFFSTTLREKKKTLCSKKSRKKRNRPPTKAQQRNMDTELVKESSKKAEAEIAQESSSKRAGEALEQESSKKQKVDDDKETKKLKQCMEIILDNGDDVTIEATPLSTKSPTIVLLMKKLDDFEDKYQVKGRIVRIKRLLDDLRVTAAKVFLGLKSDGTKTEKWKKQRAELKRKLIAQEVADWQSILNICHVVNEGMEVSKEDGKFVDTTKKGKSVKRKEETVKKKRGTSKESKKCIRRNEEPILIYVIEEQKLANDVEEMNSKVKELESKLTEVSHAFLKS